MDVPGPSALGRGVVIDEGGALPAPWVASPVVTVDEAALADPAGVVELLHGYWSAREAVVVELAVDPARFRTPQSVRVEPWRLAPGSEPWFDRLHHLVWNNNYDARTGLPIWWWGRKAAKLGGELSADGPADLLLEDGTAVWVDGGPRCPIPTSDLGGHRLVHHESVEMGVLRIAPEPVAPAGDLAEDQLAAVAHRSGPARVIAPAGSGKTRVLSERLGHLLGERGWEPGAVLAVAYNKEAQLELERRTAAFSPRVRTLNALGYWVLREHAGRPPQVAEERDCRRMVDSLLPGRRQRRANTDPIGPYLEALSSVRLGLIEPSRVESSRDDVEGLAEMFEPYRKGLADRGLIDFDEQVYRAIEILLADGEFRRSMQARCRHLLVDEFQDLTPAHVLLVRLLALPTLDVFGVGDDDQVIYGHQSADPAFLIDYGTLFPTASEHALTVNYRCPTGVVEAAKQLLSYNFRRVDKTIESGPTADSSADGLRVVTHGPDDAADTVVSVVDGWLSGGAAPVDVAVLTRVNSLLLAPQIALVEAGVPIRSVLRAEVLERTGMRAALAYLRLATAGAGRLATVDIVEILRRPTRGLPRWFPDRLERRASWSVSGVRSIADQVPDKEAAKVQRLADDLQAVLDAADAGTTRDVLEVIRDDGGLGSAMGMLDRAGGGQGSSHLDDLEGLLAVADLHPDPAGFEEWLRDRFGREHDPDGVTLSTIHRVKGREWDQVAVFGVQSGVMPHRLSDDVEEERRILHVGITRGRRRVAVLGDVSRRSRFLDELTGSAPRRIQPSHERVAAARAQRREKRGDMVVLTGAAAEAEAILRAWRTEEAKASGKPAFTVLSDAHLKGIAVARPTTAEELLACDGIGPTKLERYGDEILARLDQVAAE
ncbi:MAG: ATP-dependent DNA helicase UvrD2 [Acidimicrobiales bacterium]|nr:ATP-dependent DNA helicase UvrD2 [Acidimicrobiales bacterium]